MLAAKFPHTALHVAAEVDDLALAETLLRLGADPSIRDARYQATPLDWARHFDRPALIELLERSQLPSPPGQLGQDSPKR